MKILFITRKFPPTKGGMEKFAYELYKYLSEIINVKLVKWSSSNKWLPLVLTYFLIKSFWILFTKKIDAIHLQDGLLSPLGLVLKMFGKPVVITIHGLDITYKNKLYQFLIPNCVKRLNKVICISQATKQECINRRIPEEKITVIPIGISDEFYLNEDKNKLRSKLENKFKIRLTKKKIILSVGRLVERKGFHWFIENVLPRIVERRKDVIYLVAGDGPLRDKIKNSIKKSEMNDYAIILGRVDDETLKLLYNSSDVFVMPNIPVEGDMEGFGIVALEAASCGVPIVASNLEGIRDAIVDGKNGFLVDVYDKMGYMDVISIILTDNDRLKWKIREYSLNKYNWENIAKKFIEEITKCQYMKS